MLIFKTPGLQAVLSIIPLFLECGKYNVRCMMGCMLSSVPVDRAKGTVRGIYEQMWLILDRTGISKAPVEHRMDKM
jgi:hypothetical protein